MRSTCDDVRMHRRGTLMMLPLMLVPSLSWVTTPLCVRAVDFRLLATAPAQARQSNWGIPVQNQNLAPGIQHRDHLRRGIVLRVGKGDEPSNSWVHDLLMLGESWEDAMVTDADLVFALVDINGDGAISKAELAAHLQGAGYTTEAVDNIFAQLDVNTSGDISREELRAGFLRYSPLRQAPGLGFFEEELVEEARADADALFRRIDADVNSSLSLAELQAYLSCDTKYSDLAAANIFHVLDTDGDDMITRAELRDAFVRYSALRHALGKPGFRRTFRTFGKGRGTFVPARVLDKEL